MKYKITQKHHIEVGQGKSTKRKEPIGGTRIRNPLFHTFKSPMKIQKFQ